MSELDPQQKISAAQFDRQSAHYGRAHILADTSDVERALQGVDLPTGERALDVATGGGHTALYLARRGLRVTLGDISQKMLMAAETLLREEGHAPEAVRQFPAESMPFSDGSFSLVSSRVAPHHFTSPETFVREAARVLLPGGLFLLIDASVPDADAETAEWVHRVEKLRDPSHHRCLDRATWERLACESGLSILVSRLEPMRQPDLNWYFEAANTPEKNRRQVLDAVTSATPHVRRAMQLGEENGRITWVWQRLTLLARKAGKAPRS